MDSGKAQLINQSARNLALAGDSVSPGTGSHGAEDESVYSVVVELAVYCVQKCHTLVEFTFSNLGLAPARFASQWYSSLEVVVVAVVVVAECGRRAHSANDAQQPVTL